MSEKLEEFKAEFLKKHYEGQPIEGVIEHPNKLLKIALDERIASLIDMDEIMSDSMINYARENHIEPFEGMLVWSRTSYYRLIQEQVNHLKELRKELE